MGISAQQILNTDPNYLEKQVRTQQLESSMAPYGDISTKGAGLAGNILGGGIANLFSGRGFFDVSDPSLRAVSDVNSIVAEGLKGVDATDPQSMASAYSNLARTLSDKGYGNVASLALKEAGKYGSEVAKRDAEVAKALAKAAGDRGFKTSDVGTFIGQARQSTGKLKDNLNSITSARGYADQARSGNAKASAQLDRFLATAAGDSQISQAEVVSVANAGGFGERTIDAINKFFTGTPTGMSIQEKEDVLNVLEIVYNKRYNDERNSLSTSYTGLLPQHIVESNLPAIPLSGPAAAYMAKGQKQAAKSVASKPLSQNATQYLTPPKPVAPVRTVPQANEVPTASVNLAP